MNKKKTIGLITICFISLVLLILFVIQAQEPKETLTKEVSQVVYAYDDVIEVEETQYWYTTAYVNCREEPNTSSKILKTFEPGISLIRTGESSNGWEYITYNNGELSGYIRNDLLSETPLTEEEIKAIVDARNAKLEAARKEKQRKAEEEKKKAAAVSVNSKTTTSTKVEPVKETSTSTNGMRSLGTFKVTGYTPSPSENGGYNVTCTGVKLTSVIGKCVAVDKSIIPLGTKLYIKGIGYRTAMDTGVKGRVIDVLTSSNKESYAITGRYEVYIVE